ncbi:MAG: ABC transporter substrate-binding protein [Dehalococcoidales bacterium]|nr:ABC transporter substrate-binding protein [Dehalococcoidales bacterium]
MKGLNIKVIIFLLVIILMLANVFSCGDSEKSSTPTQAPGIQTSTGLTPAPTSASTAKAGEPQYGGVLKIIRSKPAANYGYPPKSPGSYSTARGCLETLFYYDNNGEPLPYLAESWEIAPDGKSVTINVRKGVKLHDGTDLNAELVKWNLDTYRANASSLGEITGIDVLDEHTVRLNLSHFSNVLLSTLVFTGGAMVSREAIEQNGIEWAYTNPISTGPYKLAEYKRDTSLELVRFDDYWGGKPYLDGIKYIYIADATTALMAFKAGEANILTGVSAKYVEDLKASGFDVRAVPSLTTWLAPDSANPESPFADKRVREAVSYAIDREAIAEAIGLGYLKAAYQLTPSERLGHNPSITGRKYNPEKARELLKEAGYPNGLTTTIWAGTSENKDLLLAFQRYLAEANIDVKIELVDPGKSIQLRTEGWDGLMYGGMGCDANMNQRLLVELETGGTFYVDTQRPAEWGPAMTESISTKTLEDREKAIQKLMQICYDDAMVIPLFTTYEIGAFDKHVQDCDLYKTHHVMWNIENVWLSP